MTLTELLRVAMKAVDAGEAVALRHFDYSKKPSYTFKKHHEIVTKTDVEVNRVIIKMLKHLTPDIPVISEEGGDIGCEQAATIDEAWVLDPIDGTSNFTMRLPLWGISLGLVRKGENVLGVIALPALKQRYHAIKRKGAWFGKKRLHASDAKKLQEGTGLLCYGYTDGQRARGLKALHDFSLISRTVRRLGAAVIEAAWVASGRADYAILHGAKPWDLAAGTLLIREAGGKVLTPEGKEWKIGDENVIFTAPGLAREIVQITKK